MRGAGLRKEIKLFFGDKLFLVMFLLTALFVFLTILSVLIPSKGRADAAVNSNQTTTVGEVYDGMNLSFTFHSSKPNLIGISFSTATFSRVLTEGNLTVTVSDESKNLVCTQKIDGKSIRDNGSLDISFPAQSHSEKQSYTVQFTTAGINKDHAITLWSNNSSISGASTRLNGALLEVTPVFSLAYITHSFKYTWYMVLMATFFFILTVVSYKKSGSIEWL